ncbi:MAG: hypothetical protein JSV90_04580 [Methanobacteriota archaeon]|nr:MAG: hypothetical protein JSV90_04580 [Euryarchaeota archaeon]
MASPNRSRVGIEGMSRLDDFGAVKDTCARYRDYASAASKLHPHERAAWWRDVFRRDPEMLDYVNGNARRR